MTNHTHGGTDAPECTTCENNNDEVYFQELDQAIEVSVGDLIVVGNNIFRCTSLMVNHNEPPTVIFESIVHEMVKEPATDTVKEAFSSFDEIFGNKEIRR